MFLKQPDFSYVYYRIHKGEFNALKDRSKHSTRDDAIVIDDSGSEDTTIVIDDE